MGGCSLPALLFDNGPSSFFFVLFLSSLFFVLFYSLFFFHFDSAGNGTEIDVAKAIFWYRRAAEVGHEFAELQLRCLLDAEELPGNLHEVSDKLDLELDELEAAAVQAAGEGEEDDSFWEDS